MKIAVYTSIFGGYDDLMDDQFKMDGVDYICFTDMDITSNLWNIVKSTPIYSDSNTTAIETVTIAGTGSTSTNRNYKYTTLTNPVSVSANSIYVIAFKNGYSGSPGTGGYSYHNISAYDSTLTESGNIKLISGLYKYVGTSSGVVKPTSSSTFWNYGSTDLIFLPD